MSILPLTSEKIETNSLTVGQGTPLQKAISVVANLDFPATPKNNASDLTINVPGAAIGDVVSLGVPVNAVMPVVSQLGFLLMTLLLLGLTTTIPLTITLL